jgi:hypothetical protein
VIFAGLKQEHESPTYSFIVKSLSGRQIRRSVVDSDSTKQFLDDEATQQTEGKIHCRESTQASESMTWRHEHTLAINQADV